MAEIASAYVSLLPSLKGASKVIGKELGSSAVQGEASAAGEKAGGKMSAGMGKALKAGIAALGIAGIGAGVAQAFGDAIERERLADKTAASLGLTGKQSKVAGKVAGQLYAGAYGESMADTTSAVENVMSSIEGMSSATPKQLKSVTAAALDIATAFDVDVDQAATNAGILMKTGLAKNATQAMDLITVGLQRVPKALRGEVMDATQEYSDSFAGLGFTGKQAMGALASASENGQYGIDKMGDAIKEFTIRGTDMSKTTVAAYDAIGLNSKNMTNDLLAGGDRAQGAFQKIIKGVQGIKDPAKQSQAAIALFGTPLEDLGTKDIPKFLESLTSADGGMGKVKGAAKDMGETLNDNLSTKMEGWKRSVQTFASDGVMALINGFESGKSSGKGFAGVMSSVGAAAQSTIGWIRQNKDVVQALVVAITAGVAAYKAYRIAMAITGAVKAFTAATKGATIAQRALNLVMRANPIGLIITAVAGLVAGLVWFFTKTKTGKKIVAAAWAGIKSAIAGVANWWTKTAWPNIRKVITAFQVAFAVAKILIGRAWQGIKNAAKTVWNWVRENVFNKIELALIALRVAFGIARDRISGVWTSIREALGAAADWIGTRIGRMVTFIKEVPGRLRRGFGKGWNFLKDTAAAVIGNYSAGGGGVKGLLWNIVNFVKNTLPNKIKAAAKNIWSGLVGNAMDVVGGVMKLVGKIPGVNGTIELNAAGVSKSYKYAQGGVLPGYTPGRDVHDFYSPTGGRLSLSGGEAIMRPEFTRAMGGPAGIADLNNKARRGQAFADGGIWTMEKFKAPSALPGFIKTLVNATLGKLTVPSLLNAVGDKVFSFLLGDRGGPSRGGGQGGGGIGGKGLSGNLSAMAAQARALDPSVRVTSGYRPGAITASGYRSYHGMGRALDLVSSNMGGLWDKLYAAYGKSSPELYFSGRSFSRYGKRGAPRSDHWDHVHWAMANGGVIPSLYDDGGWIPNKGLGLNLSGESERILSPDEGALFDAIKAGGLSGGGDTWHVHGADEYAIIRGIEMTKRRARGRAGYAGMRG